MVDALPTPNVTKPNWGEQLNQSIDSRYLENKSALVTEGNARIEGDENIQAQIDAINTAIPYPFAGVELAYAENGTAVVTAVPISASPSVTIPGTMLTVPANADPVYIEYGAALNVTVVGGGLLVLELWDVTAGGTGTVINAVGLGNTSAQAVTFSGLAQTLRGSYRLDMSTSDRILQLKCLLYRDTSSSLQAAVANSARASNGQPSYISAVQR